MTNGVNASRLREAAYELGLTTYRLAEMIGVPHSAVSAILLGERRATGKTLASLCEALELEMSDVILEPSV